MPRYPSYTLAMDFVEAIRARIPDFRGYEGEDERHRSDEEVRAYLGEALAKLESRLGGASSNFDSVLFRAGFANQLVVKSYEHAELGNEQINAVAACDLRLVELADRTANIDAAQVDAYLKEVESAFDARDRAMATPPG